MKKMYLLLFACLCAVFAWSQTRTITGRVLSDSAASPLEGVTVALKGGNASTATGRDGRYSITVPSRNNIVLVFSSVGYLQQEITAGEIGRAHV